MKTKNVVLGIVFLLIALAFVFWMINQAKNSSSKNEIIYQSKIKNNSLVEKSGEGTENPSADFSYESLEQYHENLDYTCISDSDCEVKDVHNCCGYYPGCVNINALVDVEFVEDFCAQSEISGVCGYLDIEGCKCVNNKCEDVIVSPIIPME